MSGSAFTSAERVVEIPNLKPPAPPVAVAQADLDYAADASAAILAERSPARQALIWAVFLCVVSALVWAYFANIDEVVKGSGKVIPSNQVQIVQNLEGGIVDRLLVREGDVVAPGQILLRIDDTRFGSSLKESRVRFLNLEAKAARLKAEAEGAGQIPDFPPSVINESPDIARREQRLFEERKGQLAASLDVLTQQFTQRQHQINELEAKARKISRNLALTSEELQLTRPLVDKGAVSEVEILHLRRQVNELRGEREETRSAAQRLESELAESKSKIGELKLQRRQEARAELNDILAELGTLSAGNEALEDRVDRTSVRTPVKGVVNKLLVNTVGGVVQPGMDLVEIVPLDDSLVVEARLSPRDIAFVRPDLAAKVKLSAYDFAIYGGLDAKVEHISADTFMNERDEPYYLVRVRTEKTELQRDGEPLPIIPGMTADVDILTGKKTVLSYLLKPILRAQANALRER
jgi:adhesin transport system membrane fusion protein